MIPYKTPSTIRPRTFTLKGRETSITLEAAFWDCLKEIAREHGVRVSELVEWIERRRSRRIKRGRSSAVRLYVLKHYQRKARAQSERLAITSQPFTERI